MNNNSRFSLIYNKIWVLYLITPFIFSPLPYKGVYSYNQEIFYFIKEYYILLISVLTVLMLLIKVIRKDIFLISKLNIYLLLFLIVVFLGVFRSNSTISSFKALLGVFFFYIAYLYGTTLPHKELKNIVILLIIITTLQGLIGILQYSDIYYRIFPLLARGDRFKITGTIGHVNHFTHYISLGFITCIFWLVKGSTFISNKFLITCSTILFFAILTTQTRGSYLAVLLTILLISFQNRQTIRKKMKYVVLIFFLVLVIFITFLSFEPSSLDRLNRTLDFNNINRISSGRLNTWKVSWELIKEKPIFGHGTGSFNKEGIRKSKEMGISYSDRIETELEIVKDGRKHKISYIRTQGMAHNEYIQIFVEQGLIGFLILILIMYNFLKRYPQSQHNLLQQLFYIILIYPIIISFYSFPFRILTISIVLFLFLGIYDKSGKIQG